MAGEWKSSGFRFDGGDLFEVDLAEKRMRCTLCGVVRGRNASRAKDHFHSADKMCSKRRRLDSVAGASDASGDSLLGAAGESVPAVRRQLAKGRIDEIIIGF